jgi:hypothetical protein
MGERSLIWLPHTLPQYIMDNSLVSYSIAKAADNAESDPVSAYKKLMGIVNDAILKNMPEKMDVYPLAAQVIRNQGWEQPMREGVNKFFSPENRTSRGRDLSYLSGVIEKIGRFLGNSAIDQSVAPLDPLAAATYGGVNARFPSKTGRFSNMADKMERFEISDAGMKIYPIDVSKIESQIQSIKDKLKPFDQKNEMWKAEARKLRVKQIDLEGQLEELSNNATLSDIVKHPSLYKQYPELKDVKVRTNPMLGEYNGAYSSEYNAIDLPSLSNPSKSTLLHEIQHAIQEKEGFARGGSPQALQGTTYISPISFDPIASAAHKIHVWRNYPKMNDTLKSLFTPEQLAEGTKLLNDVGIEGVKTRVNKAMAEAEFQAYKQLSGEIEARDAASRMNLTGQQRARTGPYTSENIPLNEWITRKEGGTAMSMPKGEGIPIPEAPPSDFYFQKVKKYGWEMPFEEWKQASADSMNESLIRNGLASKATFTANDFNNLKQIWEGSIRYGYSHKYHLHPDIIKEYLK